MSAPLKRQPFRGIRLICALLLASLLAGCGGADDRPSVTMLYQMTMYDEANSYREFRRQMNERGTEPLSIECGIHVKSGEVEEPYDPWDMNYIDGYNPRILFVELAATDLDRVRDIPWLRVADEEYRSKYVPSRPCGPLPSMPDGPNVTYVRELPAHKEQQAYWDTLSFMDQQSIFPISFSCSWQSPRNGQPWLMYIELTAFDARLLEGVSWLRAVDDMWRASHPAPGDCSLMGDWMVTPASSARPNLGV